MGAKLSRFRRSSSGRQPNSVNSNYGNMTSNRQMKRPMFHSPEKKSPKVKELTPEEWLMASPNRPDYCSESELYVFRPCSKMVHPSLPRARGRTTLSSKAIDSFCLERRVHIEEKAEVKFEVSSIPETKSGKLKKFHILLTRAVISIIVHDVRYFNY